MFKLLHVAHYSGDVFEEQSWVVRWVVVSLHFGPACQEREEVWVMKLLGIYVAGNRSNPFKTFAGTAEVQPLQQRKLFSYLFGSSRSSRPFTFSYLRNFADGVL